MHHSLERINLWVCGPLLLYHQLRKFIEIDNKLDLYGVIETTQTTNKFICNEGGSTDV